MFFFQLPWLPERLMRARRWWMLRYGFEHDARPGAFTAQDIERVVCLRDASHWVQHDQSDCLAKLLAEFFAGAPERRGLAT